MKILLLNQTFYPDQAATSQQTLDLALFLTENGHEVTAVAGRRAYENPNVLLPARETYRGVKVVRVNSTGFGKTRFVLRVVDGFTFEVMLLIKLLFFPRQDVVVSFTSPPLIGFIGTLFTLFRGGRSVQWLMDVNPDAAIAVGYLRRGGLPARFLNAVFDFTLKFSRHVVVLDRWMKDRIVAHGADPENVAVVPPWSASEVVTNPSPDLGKKFRKAHGLQDKFVILYSGNHSVVHPVDTLMEAAVLLKDDPRFVFLFIGGGLRVQDVTRYAEQHGLKNVKQLPHQPRETLRESLGSANLHIVIMGDAVSGLVHPSKIYGVLATGIPFIFIGPRRSHVADLIAQCPGGFHVENGQPTELVSLIERARRLSPQELTQYSRLNIHFVSSRYGARKSMELFRREVLEMGLEVATEIAPSARATAK